MRYDSKRQAGRREIRHHGHVYFGSCAAAAHMNLNIDAEFLRCLCTCINAR